MSYAMCLDNSWDVMCEEEMYDVNGGWGWSLSKFRHNVSYVLVVFSIALTAALGWLAKSIISTGIKLVMSGEATVETCASRLLTASKSICAKVWAWIGSKSFYVSCMVGIAVLSLGTLALGFITL